MLQGRRLQLQVWQGSRRLTIARSRKVHARLTAKAALEPNRPRYWATTLDSAIAPVVQGNTVLSLRPPPPSLSSSSLLLQAETRRCTHEPSDLTAVDTQSTYINAAPTSSVQGHMHKKGHAKSAHARGLQRRHSRSSRQVTRALGPLLTCMHSANTPSAAL